MKCTDISISEESKWPLNEIRMNQKLVATKCTHLLKFRGAGKRTTRKRVNPWGDRPDEQIILHLYTEFAQFGDLSNVVLAHAEKEL